MDSSEIMAINFYWPSQSWKTLLSEVLSKNLYVCAEVVDDYQELEDILIDVSLAQADGNIFIFFTEQPVKMNWVLNVRISK